jgi:hypothetical protein
MKMAGCNTEEEFYQKYPSEKDFFAAYPHMKGNQTMKMGGAASGHSGSYWNGDQWVSSAGDSGTYANGVYYATGGPVFMPGGSAPIFGMGGAASFNISNNEYPTPFAMAPGTGRGGGYLQDLPTHMAHGGPIPGAEIVDPFAMYPGTGKGGGMLQDLPVEMKKGGIHIAPSKRGTFTAAATKHGKSVQAFASQVLANKENYSPAMVKKANFARNAAKWKHEYGGFYEDGGSTMPDNPGFRALPPAVQQKIMSNMQTGGMVTDDRVVYGPGGQYMEQGGMVNPYHPMAKFMRGGGFYADGGDTSNPIGKYVPGMGYWNGSSFQETPPYSFTPSKEAPEYESEMPSDPNWHPPINQNQTITFDDPNRAANTGVVQQTPATWKEGMTDQQAQQNLADRPTTTEYGEQFQPKPSGWNKAANWGNAILGTGMAALGVASAFADRRDARNLRNKQFNDRSSANMYAAVNQPGGKGDYTQQGVFRPDSMTPTAAGKFYPGMPGSYGQAMGSRSTRISGTNPSTFAHGGYHVGQELELSDAEIANLKRMGYKFDIL